MPTRLSRLLAVLLIAGFVGLALTGSRRVGVTFDEPAHVTAGLAYWTTGDHRLHAENGLLPQRWAAAPAAMAGVRLPPLAGRADWQRGDVWGVARDFLFHSGHDPARVLFAARVMIALLAVGLLVLAWRWSASLWGETGGLVTVALAALCPHLLAHGALATSDLAAALGFTAATLAWWRLLHRVTPGRTLAAGATCALLALAKFSAVLFAPIAAALLVVRLARRTPLPVAGFKRGVRLRGARRLVALAGAMLAVLGLTWAGIWAGYGFRFRAAAGDGAAQFAQPWAEVLIEQPKIVTSTMADGSRDPDVAPLRPGIVQRFVAWSRAHELLPEAYLYGLAFADRFARQRLAYFAGEFSETGWREFFPAAFALKTTLPALALGGWTLLALGRRRRARYRVAPLLVFGVVYGAFALGSNLNIGHRHLLPLYPALYVACGAVVHFSRRRIAGALIAVLLAWHAVEAVRVRPHFLTYFNQLAGGPAGGHRYLVDSSLDWGQGLPDLRDWLARHAANERVYLSYFGSDEPRNYGLNATRIGDVYFDYAPGRPVLPPLQGGIYCVSATMLHRVYTQVRGPWSASYEQAYRNLAAWFAVQELRSAETRVDPVGQPIDAAGWRRELQRLEQLRFGRLVRHLERRAPDAVVANSVFIFRLSDEEIARALGGPGPE